MNTEPAARPAFDTGEGRPVLEVSDLHVAFPTHDGLVRAVNGLSFSVQPGTTVGIVGESGSGKSVAALAVMGLHRGSRAQVSGQIWLEDKELVSMPAEEIRRLRGNQVAMIFQDPLSALHPFFRVGDQLVEAYRVHHDAPA
jgi:peptide/nickel transport system ATP-binding protein